MKRHFITNEQIFDFFYNFEQGIIIISNSMEILSINKKAKNLIENSRSFRIMNGKLHHTSRIDDLTFERIIRKFIDDSRKSEQALVVKDHSTGGRLLVQLRKPDRERCDSMMMMIESDRECLVDPSPSLRRWLGLTPTETEVACLIASGLPTELIARKMGIQVGTVRTHLKHIYAKMNVHSQVQLAARVVSTATLFYCKRYSPES
ncbi:MAG: helix-turn-helix transcriptional regulator [Geminicoccaceae bacterium]|nr:helix-turn-helix transcriptional regulator [Geminicoccaceae bacterium]